MSSPKMNQPRSASARPVTERPAPPRPRRPAPPPRGSWLDEPRRTWLFRGVIGGLLALLLVAGLIIWKRAPYIFSGNDPRIAQILQLQQALRDQTRGMQPPQGNLIQLLGRADRLPPGTVPSAIAAAGGGELLMGSDEAGGYVITLSTATPEDCTLILSQPPVLAAGPRLVKIVVASGASFERGIDVNDAPNICAAGGTGVLELHYR